MSFENYYPKKSKELLVCSNKIESTHPLIHTSDLKYNAEKDIQI